MTLFGTQQKCDLPYIFCLRSEKVKFDQSLFRTLHGMQQNRTYIANFLGFETENRQV